MLLRSVGRRFFSSITSADLIVNPRAGPCLAITLHNHKEGHYEVPLVWFRDHCRSASAYNNSTNQRKSKLLNILDEAQTTQDDVQLDRDAQKLSIRWKDGHETTFDAKLLIELLVKIKPIPTQKLFKLWTSSTILSLPILEKESFSFTDFSKHFVRFGFVCVDGIEQTAEATEKFVREIAPVHDTFFGAFWVFNNKANEQEGYHEDTAYSNEEIGPHTDGTYFTQTPGIQVFHCLRPAERGGETVLVDGFAAAETLRKEDEKAWKTLTTKRIDHHYIEKGENPLLSWSPSKPVIELDESGTIRQIRFNPYDRAPFRLSRSDKPEDVLEFYRAYQAFSRVLHSPSSAIKLSLTPGTVIFIDNFRVMHARTSFSGFRQMCGCYLSRDNLMAKARLHLRPEIRLLA